MRSSHSARRARKTVSPLRSNGMKLFASIALLGGAASVAGLGTFGSFTSSTSATEQVTTGKVTLGLTQGVVGTNVSATNVVPGDTIQRAVTLTRASDSETFGSLKLTSTATVGSLLDTDTTNGLQMVIDACDVAWTQVGTTNQLTCSGNTTSVLASRPVVTGASTAVDLPAALTAVNASGHAANLRIQLTLPTNAGNTFQGITSTINFQFDATQRAATYR